MYAWFLYALFGSCHGIQLNQDRNQNQLEIKINTWFLFESIHWKKYFNVHFKSQNYSCLLDSHPCLGYRNFCCKKISCNKSKIKAVVLMEKLKQHNLGVKFTPAYFFPVTLTVKINYIDSIPCLLDSTPCLLDREYCWCKFFSLSKWQGKKYAGVNLTPRFCCLNYFH